jgi:GNAT superfamily N-acetyltransferase
VTSKRSSLPNGATLVNLNDAYDAIVFHEFYDEVLRSSLPSSELEAKRVLEARIREGGSTQTLATVVLSADGRVGGGVVGEWYAGSRCLLVGYLAVRRHLRGQGIGSLLMHDVVIGRWAQRRPELVLGEIDDPRVASPDAGGDPIARLRFFSRLPARLLRLPYLQPEVRTGEGRVRMLLIAVHAAPSALVVGGDAVHGRVVRAFIEEYFADAERTAATDDPTLAALLRWTMDEDRVTLLPLDRFEEIPSAAWETLG